VCVFNDKFLFLFGGKRLLPTSKILSAKHFYEPFEFVKEVEVFEI